ncbi:MAG: matrixin family metalloprotease [Deltaproteobacteria bacterium]|nr:MAG: matrixin family metalloprotease [Deltaproteobacteria bacterium]
MNKTKACWLGLILLGCGLLYGSTAWAWVPLVVNGRCLQKGNVCWTSIGNAGGANSCCDPSSGNITQCLSQNPCQGTSNYHWQTKDLPVLWYFNENNMAGKEGYAGLDSNTLEKQVQVGWDAWTKPSCTSFRHQYGGRTDRLPYWRDQVVVLYLTAGTDWAQLGIGPSTLAFSLPIPDSSGALRDGDIYFNPSPMAFLWGLPPVAKQQIDFTDVVAHEVGHSIGFGHSEKTDAVMYFSVRGLGPLYQGLNTDDQQAICTTYPLQQGCKANADCGNCRICDKTNCVDQVPATSESCRPCSADKDCGTNGRCVQTPQGRRCMQACGTGSCCPTGFRCATVASSKVCVPELGSCPAVTCRTDADCGSGETCTGTPKQCQPSTPPPHTKACLTTCDTDSDCPSSGTCLTVAHEAKRCVLPCTNDAFCPQGLACQRFANKSYCMPIDPPFCPCNKTSDCPTGQDCLRGLCQKPGGGQATDWCNDKVHCQTGLLCAYTANRQICAQSCDASSSTVATGTIGGPCRLNRSCDAGLSCQRLPNGPWLCLEPCKTATDCTHGGTCAPLSTGGTSYCVCREDKDCKTGKSCNNANTLLSSPTSGACGDKTLSSQCSKGFQCETLQGIYKVCLPEPNRKENEECDTFRRCVAGYKCVRHPVTPGTSICLKECGASLFCPSGTCFTVNGNNVCLCQEDSQCPFAHVCNTKLFNGRGLCECQSEACKNCGDGTCNEKGGETCETCPKDCGCGLRKCFQGKCVGTCGDGTCDPSENCSTCLDCKCPEGEECARGACRTYCGNGTCDKNETCATCILDCGCPGKQRCINAVCVGGCGDGTCDPNENCITCKDDCGCAQNKVCVQGKCEDPSTQTDCGNGTCDVTKGEGCDNCPKDCVCSATEQCSQNTCKLIPGKEPTPVIPDLPPALNLCHLSNTCPKEGCGCSGPALPPTQFWLWFSVFLFFWLLRRRS